MSEPIAVERWARSPKPRTAPWEVEERVLLEHPGARRWPSAWRWTRHSSAGGIVQVALVLAPIGQTVAIAQTPEVGLIRRSMEASAAVPLAGICALLTLVLLASTMLDWTVDGRTRDAGATAPPAIAVASSVVVLVLARSAGIDLGAWAVAHAVAGAVAALLVGIVLLGGVPASRPRRPAPVDVARLDAQERDRLLGLRARALGLLAERELVDASLVESARSAPLGSLRELQPPPARRSGGRGR